MIPETPGYTRARRLLSLSSVVRDALPVMRAAVANTAVLRIAMDAHAPLVEVNPVAMHRVLMKLVQNASPGLGIVHRAIRAHGGRLQIDSHPGHGTTVQIDLPAAPQRSGVHDSGACEGEAPNSTGHQSDG